MLRRIIFAGMIAMLVLSVYAQETISLDEMIEKALERSVTMESEIVQYKNQISSKNMSYYSWLPSASVSVSKSYSSDEWQDTGASLSASWNISSNDSRYFDMKKQMISMENAELSMEDITKNIAYSVMDLYLGVLESGDITELQRELFKLEEQKFEKIKTRYELGDTNILDYQQAEIDYISAEISLNNLIVSRDNKRAELFYYVGIEDNGETLADVEIDAAKTKPAFQANLSYIMDENSLQQQKISVFQNKLDLYPSLAFNISHSQYSSDGITDFDEYDSSTTASLSLSYSIFDYLNLRESYSMSKRQYSLMSRQLDEQKRSDLKEYTYLSNTFDTQHSNVELYQRKVDLADKTMQRAQLEYEQGTISILDLNDYQNRLYSARKNLISEKYDLLQTQESINRLLSKQILGRW